jgi:hypothetical protein
MQQVYCVVCKVGGRTVDGDTLPLRIEIPDLLRAGSELFAAVALDVRRLFRRRYDLDSQVGSNVGERFGRSANARNAS